MSAGQYKKIPGMLPWWTWVLPLFIFQFGTQISLIFKYLPASSVFYIPTAIGIVLIYWWGPRILPALYINAVLSCGFWDIHDKLTWPVYGLPETLFVFLSWYLFIRVAKGKYWLPDVNNTLKFILLGVLIPLIIYMPALKMLSVLSGDLKPEQLKQVFTISSLGDYISHISLGIPILVYFSYYFEKRGLTLNEVNISPTDYSYSRFALSKKLELIFIGILLTWVSFYTNFSQSWFFFGILSLYVSIRFGFYHVIVANVLIIFLNYFLPALIHKALNIKWANEEFIFNINLGLSLMFTFAIITGRVISDLIIAQKQINRQFRDLQRTNKELDKFVYSVSHDLSAPLKSLLGLINLSKIDKSRDNSMDYLSKMENSVHKLNEFIKDILSYSRNARTEIEISKINLEEMVNEILEDLKYLENIEKIKITKHGLTLPEIKSDKIRLKIILTNLISNAIKFHNTNQTTPEIIISSEILDNTIRIFVSDTGVGIPSEYKDKIFEMFFRGTANTQGSGLGLYIAKESAERINGTLIVESILGKGSTFILTIPADLARTLPDTQIPVLPDTF
jgi:signal transduction histidine kinase